MRLRHGIGLAVFCLLAGSRWLVDSAWPPTLPPLLGRSLQLAVAGATAMVVLLARHSPSRCGRPPLIHVVRAGFLFLCVPILTQVYGSAIQAETSVALYAMVPLCVALIVAGTKGDAARVLMMPALAGLAGALLVLPWRLPSTGTQAATFASILAGVLATAIGSVWLHELMRGAALMQRAALVAFGSAAVLGFIGLARGERMVGFSRGDFASILIAAALFFLLLWLVREVSPEQLSSRFFLLPLVTIAEGAAILRAPLDARLTLGVLLLLFGAGWLVYGGEERSVSLSFR